MHSTAFILYIFSPLKFPLWGMLLEYILLFNIWSDCRLGNPKNNWAKKTKEINKDEKSEDKAPGMAGDRSVTD